MRTLLSTQFSEDAGPLSHAVRPESYVEINNFYTSTVYEKGAELCRMMHLIIGAAAFRSGMDLYFDTYDGQAVTMENWVDCMLKAAALHCAPLAPSMQQWMLWYVVTAPPPQAECVLCKAAHGLTRRQVQYCRHTFSPHAVQL